MDTCTPLPFLGTTRTAIHAHGAFREMGILVLIIILLLCAALYPQQKLEKPWWMDQNEWNHEQEQERRRRRKTIIKVVLIAMVLALLWLVWKTCVYPTRPLPLRYEPRTMQSNISDEFVPCLQLRTISGGDVFADLVVMAEVARTQGDLLLRNGLFQTLIARDTLWDDPTGGLN